MSLSFLPRAGSVLSAAVLAATLAGCGGETPVTPDKVVATIEIAPKSAQLYTVGEQVAFTSVVTTEAGTAGEGIPVGYIARDKTLLDVNSLGVAKALKKGGSTYVVVTAGGKSDSALVEVPLTTCGSVSPTAMAVGQVVTDVGATGFCAAASSGQYTVIVHNNSLLATGSSAIEITALGVGAPPATAGPSLAKAAKPSLNLAGLGLRRRDVAAEMRHRINEAAAVAPSAAGAPAWYAARQRAARAAAAPVVGDLMTLNVNTNGTNGCTDPRTDVAARVAAVSSSAIVLADPRNPAIGTYTDAEYAQFAAMFDSIINPLDVGQFGAPTDIDNNQRVLLVFTKAINERTPPNVDYYVGGLTHSRDLATKSTCPGSNEAEMFYLIAPDSLGTINGNSFMTKGFVNAVTDATIAHEYQHLINFARRRYINAPTAQPFEERWLNEGLSHMAEELLYYRRSGRTPRTNNGANVVVTTAQLNLFLFYMLGNWLNYDSYALEPATSSPFASDDDLSTRGATWAFLRYAVDQRFTTDGTTWFNLVNSGETGATNLQNRLGVDAAGLRTLLRDFTIAAYADDYVNEVAVKYTHLSWNSRAIYPRFGDPSFFYPLAPTKLNNAAQVSNTITSGGFKPYRFSGLAGADAFIRVTGATAGALPAGITISVIRTQ